MDIKLYEHSMVYNIDFNGMDGRGWISPTLTTIRVPLANVIVEEVIGKERMEKMCLLLVI